MRFTLSAMLMMIGVSLVAMQPVTGQKSTGESSQEPQPAGTPCVVVAGAVRTPARYKLTGPMRLTDVIALAGGLTAAAGETIQIIHSKMNCGGETQNPHSDSDSVTEDTYYFGSLISRTDKANPEILPGDIIIIHESPVVYIVGNVSKPHGVYLRDGLTLTQAIAQAGGTLRDSKTDRVRIYRQLRGSNSPAIITVDLKKIAKGRAADCVLAPWDVIEVPSKNQRYRLPMIAIS